MSTFTVTNTNDIGKGSLRQAIREANALTGKDIINFDGVFADSIADTITLGGSSLTITDDLSIKGTGAEKLTVSGNNKSRVFDIGSNITVEIDKLTIANGYYNSYIDITGGGGIYNDGTLTLSNSTVTGNKTSNGLGGGIYNDGILTLLNSTVSYNDAEYAAGEEIPGLEYVEPKGGGIYNNGSLTLSQSTVSNNNSSRYTGGIYSDGTLTILHSTVKDNYSSFFDGGINNYGTAIVSYSTISGNRSENGDGGISNGGTLEVSYSTISGNFGRGSGGGIRNGGIATVSHSTITENYSRFGAAIDNAGTLTVSYSSIKNNSGYIGGSGIGNFSNGTLIVSNSTISGNSGAFFGGGIYDNSEETGGKSSILVINSTISDNYASISGGGIYSQSNSLIVVNSTISGNSSSGTGGGIYNEGTATVSNSTIAFNTINEYYSQDNTGAGIYNSDSGTTITQNSIIAGNKSTNTDINTTVNSDVVGNFTSNGFNLIGDLSGSTGFQASEQLNVPITEVLDTTLRDNGGPVKTHALVIGSAAINGGNNADVPLDTTDLDGDGNTSEKIPFDGRGAGYQRISGGRVDIGAFEAVVNVINGTIRGDTINGTPANDIVTGYQGRDILRGGGGADAFVYTNIRDLGDTIADFEVDTDKIVLGQIFENLNRSDLNYASAISGGYLGFETQGSDTIVFIDPDGSTGKGRKVNLVKINNVTATDLNKTKNFAF